MKLPTWWRGDHNRGVALAPNEALHNWSKKYLAVLNHIRHVFVEGNLHPSYNFYRAPYLILSELIAESDEFVTPDWSGEVFFIASAIHHAAFQALTISSRFNRRLLRLITPEVGISGDQERRIRDRSAKVIVELASILDNSELCRRLESFPKQEMLVVAEHYPEWLKNCAFLEAPADYEKTGGFLNPAILMAYRFVGGEPEAIIAGAIEAAQRLISVFEVENGILPICGYAIARRGHWPSLMFGSKELELRPLVKWANEYWECNVTAALAPVLSESCSNKPEDRLIVLRSFQSNPEKLSPQSNPALSVAVNEKDELALGFVMFLVELMSQIIKINLVEPSGSEPDSDVQEEL